MVAPLTIEGGITIENGISVGTQVSFTLNPNDFTGIQYVSGGTANYSGFTGYGVDTLGNEYVQYVSPNTGVASKITAAFSAAGMSYGQQPNNTAYIWQVYWAPGSTYQQGFVRLSWDDYNNAFWISAVNTGADNAWEYYNTDSTSPGPSTPALAGTFLFPATFSARIPLIECGGNYWC